MTIGIKTGTQDGAKLIFEKSKAGKLGAALPARKFPERNFSELIPQTLQRKSEAALPEVSEPEIVRHFVNLSKKNFSVDTHFYPLGSCTMKYNPKIHEDLAALDGFAWVHPEQPEEQVQGVLQIFYELERALSAITGMDEFTLEPAAGAHGELLGMMLTRAYHASRGESKRSLVLVPDSSHGTNPASAAQYGYDVVQIPSNEKGRVDLIALERALSDRVACLMLTNPNTLGLFETDILKIRELVHAKGALLYYDGANLNALVGALRPGDMGFDIVHLNLHKTFTTPHGGGGPGAGPVGVKRALAPFLPVPRIALRHCEESRLRGGTTKQSPDRGSEIASVASLPRNDGPGSGILYTFDHNRPQSVGKIRSFYGNAGILIRAYVYIRMLGLDGLRRVSHDAVLNANYLRKKLSAAFQNPHNEPCMHEFVLSAENLAARGIHALDLGKRLLDYGIHAPTVHFPLVVKEALMIEPTETESKDTLDHFVEIMLKIRQEVDESPELIRSAPHTTAIARPDEVAAARKPILSFRDLKIDQT